MKTALKIYSFALVLMPAMFLLAQVSKWPVIRSLEEKRIFSNPGKDNADTPFIALIRDSGGVPAYKLECHNGNYDDESEINFSGDFQCALFAVKGNTLASGNLLAANTKNELSTDWWNRGRMRSVQLRGECLKYPEYSTVRHFKLRGILLTLRFTETEWSNAKDPQGNPLIGKFTFIANAVPDPTAKSPSAEEVEGAAPPTSCYP
jgi:hypothetical protein